MKVLVLNTLYPPHVVGGAEKSVNLLCEALVRTGIEVVVASLHPENTTRVETVNGVKVYRLPIDNIYWPFDQKERSPFLKLQWHLRDIWNGVARHRFSGILQDERPDILHTNNLTGFSVSVWAEASARSLKTVHTLRDYSLLCRRATLFRAGQNCTRRCLDCAMMTLPSKRLSNHVDRLISNSRFLLDRHVSEGYFAGTPSEVIYNIMETVDLNETPPARREATLTFGYLGKIDQDKGIEIVLRATTKLKRPDWKLKIAGRGDERYVAHLKQTFADPRIKWLGFTPVRDVMNQIDVTIISSIWYEPLPRVLIESIAYRRPTICSTAGGIPEIAHFADLIGIYEPTDADALARLMEQAMHDGRFAWTYRDDRAHDLSQQFDPSIVAGRNLAVYQAALSQKGVE